MDLSFQRGGGVKAFGARPSGGMRVPAWPYLRTVSAARQSVSPTALAIAGVLRGQDGEGDWIRALAHVFAPRADGVIEAGRLAGSFSPPIASRQQVGQE
jgi:hypothetical protein